MTQMQQQRPPTVFDIFPSVEQKAIVPTENDVLCGKDKTFSQHSGNRRYKTLIDSQGLNYANASTKQMKMDITKFIYESMRTSGSRFIEPTGANCWNELSDSKARDKISHALRFFAKQHNHVGKGSEESGNAVEVPMAPKSAKVLSAAGTTENPYSNLTPAIQPSSTPATNHQNTTTAHPPPSANLPPTAPSHVFHNTSTASMNPTHSISSTYSSNQHPLGILGEAARFLLSTTTPTSSINRNSDTMRSMESYDAMNTLQSHELRELFQNVIGSEFDEDGMEE